jgi:hypothetical protein
MSCRLCELTMNVRSLSSDRIRFFIADAVAGSRPRGRLVEQHQLRRAQERLRDRDALQHAVAQRLGRLLRRVGQQHQLQYARRLRARRRRREPLQLGEHRELALHGTPFTNAAS